MCEKVISRLSNSYINCITIPVINNIPGIPIQNIRGSLRQGCPGSMGWFSIAIDPLLLFLERILEGIPICSVPSLGPLAEGQLAIPPVEERYKVYGLADDVRAICLFEMSSGNLLYRDSIKGKCKVLALGRWRNTLQQEDIGHPHFRLSDRLSMVGVELLASWQQTRKINNDELLARVKSTIGSWKSGKFMPLASRPFSVNCYCLSKVWFRTFSVDLRAGDILAISSACKKWIYQDMFEKPNDLLLYRPTEQGGLGLHHIRSKSLASLITTFLQTAAHPGFQQSLYHSLLYRHHCLLDDTAPYLAPPPYYTQEFFNVIKDVKQNTPLNPVNMTVKEWYRHLLEKDVTMEIVDEEGRMVPKLCKVEEREPQHDWNLAFHLSRLKGLAPEVKSFNFKLLHLLLPCKERMSQMLPATSPNCPLCTTEQPETITHALFGCAKNREAGQFLLQLSKVYDPSLTPEKAVRCQLKTDSLYELPTTLMLYTGLELIWNNRQQKKSTSLYFTRAEIESLICTLRKSRPKRLREAGAIISNTLENFGVI